MVQYFRYLKEIFEAVMRNIGRFFATVFASPWEPVGAEFKEYGEIFDAYKGDFGFWGWFFYVLMWILLAAIVGGIIYLIVLAVRKTNEAMKKTNDRKRLLEQIEKLNYELFKANNEKNKILNLKVAQLGLTPAELLEKQKEEEEKEENKDNSTLRFSKLCTVDSNYRKDAALGQVVMGETDKITLDLLVERFRNFAASQLGLYYELKTLRAFFAGLGTSKIIILEGISGTGKTSLPYALGKFIQNDAKIASVQPSWRDRNELLGYFNEFTKKFNETDFLKAIYEATYRNDVNIIILDEMNLARIEYYFAEFLSIMEMPNISEWNIELIQSPDEKTDPEHFHEGKLLIPQNVWFIGTANNDDSTFTITDKVYDRAISIFFSNKGIAFDCEFADKINITYEYLNKLYQDAQTNYPVTAKMLEKFDKLDTFVIQKFKLAFGNRILKQLKTFVPCYVAAGGTELEGFDFIFSSKILKKFEVLNVAFLKDELRELSAQLDKLFGKNTFVESKKVIENLIKMN